MRWKILTCLAALVLSAGPTSASPLAQSAGAKAAVPTSGVQLAQGEKWERRSGGGDGVYRGGGRSSGGDGVYRGGGRSSGGDGVYRGGGRSSGGDGVYRGGGRSSGGDGVYTGGRGGDGVYTGGRRLSRGDGVYRGGGRDVRRFDGDRRFVERGRAWRGDNWRHRRAYRDGITVYPYSSYAYTGRCHRHFRDVRVMRHCHPAGYGWHRHGPWRS